MPHSCDWNESTRSGNPTKSKLVNNIIAAVKKKETRGSGKKSKACRFFTAMKFEQIVALIEQQEQTPEIDMLRFQAW